MLNIHPFLTIDILVHLTNSYSLGVAYIHCIHMVRITWMMHFCESLPSLRLEIASWELEIGHDGSIDATEIRELYTSELLIPPESQLLDIFQFTTSENSTLIKREVNVVVLAYKKEEKTASAGGFVGFFWGGGAVLGLHFCARAFSTCSERGPLFIAARGLLTVAASLVAEHRLQTRRLSSCGSRA